MSEVAAKLGEHIRKIRQSKGISQEKLAERANLNTSFIGQIERGTKKPTVETLEKIVKALDISFHELFAFESDKNEIKDTTIIEKMVYEMNSLPLKEQEAVYKIIKQIIQIKET